MSTDAPPEPRSAAPADYTRLVAFLDRNFPATAPFGGMAATHGHITGPDPETMANYYLVEQDGRLASVLGVFPLETVVGPRRLTLGGIGAVATDDVFRGRGLMSAQLLHAQSEMARKGFPLSILWGNRARYGRYGWELAGRQEHFTLEAKRLDDIAPHIADAVVDYNGSETHRRTIDQLYRQHPLRQERIGTMTAAVLNRTIAEARLVEEASSPAYIVLDRRSQSPKVLEYGGAAEGFVRLVRDAMARAHASGIEVIAPAGADDRITALCRREASFRRIAPLGTIRIDALAETLAAWRDRIDRCVAGLGRVRPVSLSIVGREEPAVRLGGEEGGEPIGLSLSEREMVRLVFGPLEPGGEISLPGEAQWLEAIFPLPLYVWPLNHV